MSDIPNKLTTIGAMTASQGAVAVGVAKDGSTITVYNITVPDAVIHTLAQQSELSAERATAATRAYLEYTQQQYRYLPLRGMGDNSGLRLKFPLVELFIPLNARLSLPKSADTLPKELRSGGKALSEEDRQSLGRLDEPKPVLALIAEHPVLVILGDPGAGKSTVMKWLAYILATGQGHVLGLPDYFPLLLPLAAYAEILQTKPNLSLRKFTVDYFKDTVDVDGLDQLVEGKFKQGKVLVLLDGLDEVKEQSQRLTVVNRVQHFICQCREQGNRVIMTSRIIGYREVRPPEVAGLRECTLLDFEDQEIETFIRRWTQTIEGLAYDDATRAQYEADREAQELLQSLDRNQALRKLAANPLLLTMLVIQKRQGVQLPDQRVLLYEQYICSLMRDWLLVRSEHGAPRDLPNDRELRKDLEPLALWLQETEPGQNLVNEQVLLGWLRDRFEKKGNPNPEAAAQGFLSDVREHSGLLLDRGARKFGFLHLTFMEYLAGVAIANLYQRKNGPEMIRNYLVSHAHRAEWLETLLLSMSYLGIKQRFDETTSVLLWTFLAQDAVEEGSHHLLVARMLAEMGKEGVTADAWMKLLQRLVSEGLRSDTIPAQTRVQIGRQLSIAGDPRDEVLKVDTMQFCFIPPGALYLGSPDDDELAYDDEQGAGEYVIDKAYWMARYPVSVAQCREFVTESGFVVKDSRWSEADANTPVVYQSWDEAIAFCEWLNTRWHQTGALPNGYRVSLPSEPEWEKAARGSLQLPLHTVPVPILEVAKQHSVYVAQKTSMHANPSPRRRYPWGEEVDAEKANYAMNVGDVSALGAYPQGHSPYDCEDMSGHVWEWTRSLWKKYPYPVDGLGRRQREDLEAPGPRVLRGGSFYGFARYVRGAYRFYYDPDSRYYYIGFRVVLSPYL